MSILDVEDGKSTAKSSFSLSQSSSSCSRSATPASTPSVLRKVSNKVTERHFTPRTRPLAIASKAHIRTRIIYDPAGPFNGMNSRIARLEYAWATVKEAANNSDDSQMKDAFKWASNNDITKKNLITFVSYLLINQQ